jgi:hypothetical protein
MLDSEPTIMNKRLDKKHKRQVNRAKENKQTSQPDVRTHEQIEAARQTSRAVSGAGSRSNRPTLASAAR